MSEPSIFSFIWHAGPVVKLVMLILFAASVASWMFIFQRWTYLKQIKAATDLFEENFWSGRDLGRLYSELSARQEQLQGMEHIFQAGFKEFMRLRQQPKISSDAIVEAVQRAMRVATAQELEQLEASLSFLATVGSTSPYIGLFGTVWGIMTSFRALAGVQQATIAMVAPGISEALIATAIGLFAAIPAVIAYNRYSAIVERMLNRYDTFQEEFAGILYRQVNAHA